MKTYQTTMNRIALLGILALLAGCATGPGPETATLRLDPARQGLYGFKGPLLQFVFVTDGRIGSSSAQYKLFSGNTWAGSITPLSADPANLDFKADDSSIWFGNRIFHFEDGRAFVVTTGKGAVDIRQIKIGLQEELNALAKEDRRFDLQVP